MTFILALLLTVAAGSIAALYRRLDEEQDYSAALTAALGKAHKETLYLRNKFNEPDPDLNVGETP